MYAWANHGWVTTVGTVLIGPWLLALATTAAGSARGTLFTVGPWSLSAAAFPSFAITVAALVQIPCLPLFGALADGRRSARRVLAWTCAVGAAITMLLATTGGTAWAYAGALFVAGSLVFGATDVVYNAFLPRLSSREHRDRTSSRGFATGYLGAGVLLVVSLALLQFHDFVGVDRTTAVRLCYVLAGLWWAGFGWYAIRGLRERRASDDGRRHSVRRLAASLRALGGMPNVLRYLLAYLFFADAISAVIGLSSTYVTHELYHDDASAAATFLFALILVIQFLAVPGSLAWAPVARRIGTKRAILVTLVIWCGIVVYAFAALRTKLEAVVLGVIIAAVIGGSQALARGLFSTLVPRGRETTFFGLFEISDKGTSWIAPLLFTVVVDATGSFRYAILSLIAMFAIGIVLLAVTDVEQARKEASA
jgi:MFS transporter, UMF1 family